MNLITAEERFMNRQHPVNIQQRMLNDSHVQGLEPVNINRIEELADTFYGNVISGSGDPNDTDFSGVAILVDGIQVGSVTYAISGWNAGTLQFGISSIDGTAYFAAGAGVINSAGLTMSGLNYFVNYVGTYSSTTRYANSGMFLPSVGATTTPAFGFNYYAAAGTNVITDDTLASYTDSQSVWATGAISPGGTNNSFYHAPTLGFPGKLTRTWTGVSASTLYQFSFYSKVTQGAFIPSITVQEQTSGHASTGSAHIIQGAVNPAWVQYSTSFTTQSNTAEVLITMDPGWNFNAVYFDALNLAPSTVSWTEWLTDVGKYTTAPQIFQEQAAPTAPISGYDMLFAHSTYKVLAVQNTNGYVSPLPAVGWETYVFPYGWSLSAAAAGSSVITNSGGSIATPFVLTAPFLLQSVSVWNLNTTLARTWMWDLYIQYTNTGSSSENTLTRVATGTGAETFTASAPSDRTITASSAPVYLSPGIYWLVLQNQHASNGFTLPTTTYTGNMTDISLSQTKTTSNPNGSTLDFVAATWTKNRFIPEIAMKGRVFGQTAAF